MVPYVVCAAATIPVDEPAGLAEHLAAPALWCGENETVMVLVLVLLLL